MSVVSGSFRTRVRAGVEPIARLFGRVGLTPNALTLIGFGIAIIAAGAAATQQWLAAGLLVAFGALFDLFDGALARATNRTSRLGAFMDSTFDRAGEAVVYIGIAAGLAFAGQDAAATLAPGAMGAAFMVSYARAKSESLGFSSGTGMASVGVAPREVRVVVLAIGLLTAPIEPRLLLGALALIAILATITTIQRILYVYKQSKNQEVDK